MVNKKLVFLVSLLLLISIGPVINASDSQVVEVEGMASVTAGNLVQVKEQAINNALRRAVEQVAGTFISATTKVRNAKLIKDEILKNSQGYVTGYKVLHKELSGSLYQVRLRVKVGVKDLSADVEALKMNIKRIGNPRIMILISQLKEGYYLNLSSSIVETELMDQFVSSGYQVIDRYMINKIITREQRRSILQGDFQLATKLGSKLNADFIVVGDARASYVDLDDMFSDSVASSLKSYNAQINARVINTATAQVIAAVNSNGQGAGINKESAAKKALVTASSNLADNLIEKISKDLIQGEKTIKIRIAGVKSLSQLNQLRNALPTLSGVKDSYFRDYGSGLATFDLDLETTAKILNLAIELKERVNFAFKIRSMSATKLVIKIK
ncbi:Protein of unknown function, DUF400 [Halobacteroides halobius DSM 5150]|uniref:Uncharacterized protein n=1 Tax=Halobacteroides halobius (strain ATCC 35273 / DSM 5150 / MD-1) TaxID=748449 RepID=L0KCX3_HALHC|nr:FlgO family outer membrane protein [Halobacteroides halobius]AGB42234.1 Protein of unknown function, DUF400 [Halobacteroides halobius DSM 5150]